MRNVTGPQQPCRVVSGPSFVASTANEMLLKWCQTRFSFRPSLAVRHGFAEPRPTGRSVHRVS